MCIVSNIKILVCVSILIASVLSFGKVLIDEDFTDGKLDNTNAGDNGSRWSYFGGGDVGFKTPNNRSGFSKALARRSDGGGSSWAGLKWQVWNDDNGNNEKEPEEFKRFSIEKGTQAIYAEFTCFSDVAKSSADYYGVEIAMLEEVSDA